MGDLTSASETRIDIYDWWKSRNAQYVEYVLVYPSDLKAIVDIDIYTIPYLDGLRPTGLLKKTFMEPLDLGKAAGSYCKPLLVGSSHEFYPA